MDRSSRASQASTTHVSQPGRRRPGPEAFVASDPSQAPDFLIVGTARSGTTLVQRLACEIPGVAVPPETHFFYSFAPGLVRRRRFPLDRRAIEEEVDRFARLETSSGLELDACDITARLRGRCASPIQLFGAIVGQLAGDASRHGEKTPNHLLWWSSISRAAPWMRFITVVRDPRAVVASYRSTWDSESYLVTAERWASDQRQAAKLVAELGAERSLLLRYEDVVACPEAARSRIASFLGLEPPVSIPGRPPGDLHLAWETWKERALQAVTRERVDAWQQTLGDDEAQHVATLCEREMALFGYSDQGARVPPRQRLRIFHLDLYGRARFRARRGMRFLDMRLTRLA